MAVTFSPDNVTIQDAKTGEIPIDISDDIITSVKTGSSIMKLAKAVPMDKPRKKFTFMTGVGAYWVDEGQKITTSKPTWLEAYMDAHKMAVIIPTTNENLKYSVTDFFDLMKAEITEAFLKKFDQSTMFGGDSPFKQSLLGSAALANQTTVETANKYDDISGAMGFLEENDINPNGIAAPPSQKRKYRSTKDNNGKPMFTTVHDNTPDDILGLPVSWAPKDSWDKAKATEILADWDNVYYGILGGIDYKILTEATLSTVLGEDGNPINLAERDMCAIRATFSPAFLVIKDEAISAVLPSGVTAEKNKKAARRKVRKHDPEEDTETADTDTSDGKTAADAGSGSGTTK